MHQKIVMLLLQNNLKKIRKRSYKKCECNITKKNYLKLKDLIKKKS